MYVVAASVCTLSESCCDVHVYYTTVYVHRPVTLDFSYLFIYKYGLDSLGIVNINVNRTSFLSIWVL